MSKRALVALLVVLLSAAWTGGLRAQVESSQTEPALSRQEISEGLRRAYRGISTEESPRDRANQLGARVLAAGLELLYRLLYSDDSALIVWRLLVLAALITGLFLLVRFAVRRIRMVPSRSLLLQGDL